MEGRVRDQIASCSTPRYNIRLSRNVHNIVCEPKLYAFFDAFSSSLIFLFVVRQEEMQGGSHQTSVSRIKSEDGAKNFPRETPSIDGSLEIRRRNENVVSKFL